MNFGGLDVANPTLAFVTAAKAVTVDGGTTAGKTLTGSTARDVFVLHAGTSNGDTITNFKPSLTAGDFLELKGYGDLYARERAALA